MKKYLFVLNFFFFTPFVFGKPLPIEQINPQSWRVHSDAFSHDEQNAEVLLGKDVVEPSFLEEESEDIKIIKINQGSLLHQAGFQTGDRIVGVNGEALDGAWSTLTLLKELKNSNSSVSIQVSRQGKVKSQQYLFEGNSLQELSLIFIQELTAYLNPFNG